MSKKKSDHHQRFNRWLNRLTDREYYLVSQVLARIVPEFERHGFVWPVDFANNDRQEIGANEIPLQRRGEGDWPTVQIIFRRGWFRIYLGLLPEQCRKLTANGYEWIPRENAIALYAPAAFLLCRGKLRSCSQDSEFGLGGFCSVLTSPTGWLRYVNKLFFYQKFIDSELDELIGLLPVLFELFDKGIPQEWLVHERGQISPNFRLMFSWYLHDCAFGENKAR
jgi:hypothetical protein